MSRPTSRAELLSACEVEHEALLRQLAALPDDVREDAEAAWDVDDQSRNPRDVLAHLHAWHELMIGWHGAAEAGATPAVPAQGYSWAQTPALNAHIWDEHSTWSYRQALEAYEASRLACVAIIEAHTDEELFTRKRYSWTGTSFLAQYLIGATSSHDIWAVKTLRRIAKAAAAGRRT